MLTKHKLCHAVSIALIALPLMVHVPTVAAQQAVANDAVTLDTLVVQSQLESQERAIDLKRDADAISDVIAADSIGQYPDKNVAESLQRLPGVSVTRDQGEARFVVVRGLDATLNSVTVNGISIGTPEDGSRSATLDVIPSDSTERITVIKAPTPDMPGDSIGGSINIESASGFDRDGRSVRARVEGSYNELSGQTSPKGAFNYSNVFNDTFGVAFGVSYQDRDFQSDNIEVEYDFNDALGEDVFLAQEVQLRKYFVSRERLGANLNLDWRPDADNRYFLRTLFSDFQDAETRQRSIFVFGAGDLVGNDNGVYSIEGIPADEVRRRIRFRTKNQATLAVSGGGEHRFGNALLDYQVGYTDTRERVLDEVEGRFEYDSDSDLSARLDQNRPIPGITINDPAGDGYLRNANYVLDRFVTSPKIIDDDEFSAGFNFAFNTADNVQWKTGLSGRWRDRFVDADEAEFRDVPDLNLGELTIGAPAHRQGNLGDGIGSDALLDFFSRNAGDIRERPQDIAENQAISAAEDYASSEDILAAYGMATMDFGQLRVIAGVRVEQTDFEATGNVIELDEDGDFVTPFAQRTVSSHYTSVLPGLHLRYDANDWVVRGAWTNTIARPGFSDLSPRLTINREDKEIDAGNPDLDPYESSNIDLSAELYTGEAGLLSVGLFHKDIEGYIAQTRTDADPQFPGFEVTRPVNGDDAKVFGLEVNWQTQLQQLPGAWSGLLLGANATVLDTTFSLPQRPDEHFTLPRASEEIYSAFIGYEKHGLSTRLAAVRRGEYLDEIGDDGNFDLYVAANTQLDFSMDYAFGERWSIYFEASNLLDEPLELYQGSPANTLQNEQYGRTYAVGVKVNL